MISGWPRAVRELAGLIHVRVPPTWLRYSDFGQRPEVILELSASELAALR